MVPESIHNGLLKHDEISLKSLESEPKVPKHGGTSLKHAILLKHDATLFKLFKVLFTLLKHVGIFMVWVLVWLICALVTAPTITSTATISIAEAMVISLGLVDITQQLLSIFKYSTKLGNGEWGFSCMQPTCLIQLPHKPVPYLSAYR
jgi:hypothetical protein